MDFMNQIKNNSFINYYDSIYYSFLENKEENIIIINQNSYNPFNLFSNHIKKFNTKLYLFQNENILNYLDNEQNHELNHHIQLYKMNYENITNCFLNLQKENKENKRNKLILMHIHSNNCLENIVKICSYFKSELYIYISLLMNNKYKIYFKNELRNFITYLHNDSTKLGQVFDYDEIFNYLNNIKNSKITKIDLIHDNHYVSYGNSKLYLFILDFY